MPALQFISSIVLVSLINSSCGFVVTYPSRVASANVFINTNIALDTGIQTLLVAKKDDYRFGAKRAFSMAPDMRSYQNYEIIEHTKHHNTCSATRLNAKIANAQIENEKNFQWTIPTIIQSISLFIVAGCAEILGGWLVWSALRGQPKKPWYFAILGSITLTIYGFIPCLQPTDNFGRLNAAYGGFFICMSFLFGWLLDGNKPDIGDIVGGCISLVGVLVVMFWPRGLK